MDGKVIKPIDGYDKYFVSEQGHVFSVGSDKKLREVAPSDNKKGYLKVTLCNHGKRKTCYVHRLVAQAFLKNPQALPMVNHKDFNKHNNSVDNLEYCTARYNMAYSVMAGKHSSRYLGVTWDKNRRKWMAQYQVGNKKFFIGRFETQEEAHEAYMNAIKKI